MANKNDTSAVRETNLIGKKKRFTQTTAFWLCLALLLTLIGAVFAQMINTNFYQTDLIDFSIPTDDGQWVRGTVFKPKTATSSNPAPAVVFVPGFQRTKESHYDIALEVARRGMVCFIIDPYNQGDSSASLNTSSSSAEGGAYGAIPLVNYLYDTDNVNYINKDQISIIGHSAGGNSALTAAVHFSNEAGGVYENCKIKAVYVSGYIRNIIDVDYVVDDEGNRLFVNPETGEETTDKFGGYLKLGPNGVDWDGCKCANLCVNLGFGYCEFDEGAWQNVNLTGDISRPDSYESLALMTSGGNHLYLRETGIEVGKIYGQPTDGTMRVGYQENTLHGVQPFDIRSTAHILYYLDYLYELDGTIDCNNQIWGWKQFFQLVLMIGVFMFIFPVTQLLLDSSFFQSIKFQREVKPRPKSAKSWIVFAVTLLLGATCACFSFVPLADLSKILFADAAAHKVTWFFAERMNNAIMLWAVVSGAFGLCLCF
ncbi:MAG: alpha/beta hydrolase family protein, partial [Candidatus Fimimonas sp.]